MYAANPNSSDTNLMIHDGVSVLQRVELDLILVLPDHGQKLPVGVPGVDVLQGHLLLHDLGLLGASLLSVPSKFLNLLQDVGSAASL